MVDLSIAMLNYQRVSLFLKNILFLNIFIVSWVGSPGSLVTSALGISSPSKTHHWWQGRWDPQRIFRIFLQIFLGKSNGWHGKKWGSTMPNENTMFWCLWGFQISIYVAGSWHCLTNICCWKWDVGIQNRNLHCKPFTSLIHPRGFVADICDRQKCCGHNWMITWKWLIVIDPRFLDICVCPKLFVCFFPGQDAGFRKQWNSQVDISKLLETLKVEMPKLFTLW